MNARDRTKLQQLAFKFRNIADAPGSGGQRWQVTLTKADAQAIAETLEAALFRDKPLAEQVRQPQTPGTGIAAIAGKWPGDETDEEVQAALDQLS